MYDGGLAVTCSVPEAIIGRDIIFQEIVQTNVIIIITVWSLWYHQGSFGKLNVLAEWQTTV